MPDDIRLLISFKGHHKRKRLKRKLGGGYLDYIVDLWLSVAVNRPNGVLHGWNHDDIADYSGWENDSDLYVRALVDTGWLDVYRNDGGVYTYKCHDWEIHQPWVIGAEERKEKARLAALIKNHGEKKGRKLFNQAQTPINTEQVQAACNEHASSTCGEHAPFLSLPSPLPKNKSITSKRQNRFDDFWKEYPKKIEKKKAKEIWKRRKLDSLADTIIQDVKKRRTSKKWQGGFILNPTTYLNGDRWEDEIEIDESQQPAQPIVTKPKSTRCGNCFYFYRKEEDGCFDKEVSGIGCDRYAFDPQAMGRMVNHNKKT